MAVLGATLVTPVTAVDKFVTKTPASPGVPLVYEASTHSFSMRVGNVVTDSLFRAPHGGRGQ
jgi:hypothetical protein